MLEINDEELRAIDKVHHELQDKYSRRPWTGDITQMISIKNDITDRFHRLGFRVEVAIKQNQFTGLVTPEVEFIGRTDRALEETLKKETDWERREYDLRKTSVDELKKSSQNTHLLE